jgi:crotonobetainyl-CoA:carnitine CoA-transferase CaiB-like acyl-CoA transferase
MASLPLAGVTVLDLSAVIMGPWATHQLAQMGATIWKVEAPAGDTMRFADEWGHPGLAPMFRHSNRGKMSVVLDLKRPEALAACLRLAARADVMVHNIRPQAAARLGLGWESVRAANPAIVYACLTGFSSDGPLGGRPAYDDLIQGASGLAAMFDPPRYVPALVADRYVGMAAATAILGALLAARATGEGRAIEVPMFETMAELVLADHLNGHSFEPPTGPTGYSRITSPNRRPYRSADGFVCIIVYTERHWRRFFAAVGEEERFLADPILSSAEQRRGDFDRVYGMVAEIVARHPTAFWLEVGAREDIPVMPLASVETLKDDAQLGATGVLRLDAGERALASPVRWGAAREPLPPAPRLGEHTRDVLAEAGLSAAEIDALAAGEAAHP